MSAGKAREGGGECGETGWVPKGVLGSRDVRLELQAVKLCE